MAVSGGLQNVAFLACLIVFYGAGTAVLQAAFQRGGALTTAGLSTLLTNALPIVAGMVLFHEPLPSGLIGAVRVAAFVVVVAEAVLLAARSNETESLPPRQELAQQRSPAKPTHTPSCGHVPARATTRTACGGASG